MNISYNWLKQYINIDLPVDEVAKILTSIGLECGSVEEVQSIKGGLQGLVVGEVLTCVNHENSDHLHVTSVKINDAEAPLQIVCGAPNVAAGQKVIVATIGAKLYPADGSEFVIKRSKIRGVESFGMLCAEDEIGVGTNHDGIIVLPQDTPIGLPAADYYRVENDSVIEVDITPNRSDAISHYGVARDLAAYFATRNSAVKLSKPSVDEFKVDNHDFEVQVSVENKEACPRYSGLTISGVTVKESPDWLKNRLMTIGLHPINNIVDITNYVLHALGHPMHAFDGDKLKGGKIVVKNLAEGTKFTTLDGVERSLRDADLMICNAEEGMCIAGVFGGLDSGITESTTKIFLESAYFNPTHVRKTARAHGLNTDASFRYERGCDPNNTIFVLKYAAMLIKEIAGGTISSDIVDIYPNKIEPFKVNLTYKKVNNLIGLNFDEATIKSILKGLEIEIVEETEEEIALRVPTYRVDVQRDVDVIEDILRIYGYNQIPFDESLKSSISYTEKPESNRVQNLISEQLTANGFYEILNNSLTKSSYYADLKTFPAENCVKIMNPLGVDLSVLRQTLLFGGLESIARNRNYKNNNLKFYEFGNCYYYQSENKKDDHALSPYAEDLHLGLWLCGNKTSQSWVQKEEKTTVFELKAYVENILIRVGLNQNNIEVKNLTNDIFSTALQIDTKAGKNLVVFGCVNKGVLNNFDIDTEVFFADINWTNLIKAVRNYKITYCDIPKFPEVRRDLALLIDKNVTFAEIEKIAYETEKKLLKKVNLFDVYEGKNLPAGKKSYAVSFVLQDSEKTLKDAQIDAIMQRLIKNLADKIGASLR